MQNIINKDLRLENRLEHIYKLIARKDSNDHSVQALEEFIYDLSLHPSPKTVAILIDLVESYDVASAYGVLLTDEFSLYLSMEEKKWVGERFRARFG